MSNIKTIAFYLPQYHPIPENDLWWGRGFTEWTNVAKTKPRFAGHHQPQLPADLGFYDLRVPETRDAQAKMALSYGVSGFCYYHYWFDGKLLLDRPLREVIKSGAPNFPFCVCWANENWTRAWDGLDRQVLMKQSYSAEDMLSHILHLHSFFADSRYIRINNRPVVLIYRPDVIPDLSKHLATWRAVTKTELGVELYIAGVRNGFSTMSDLEYIEVGFDSVVDFQPNREVFPPAVGAVANIKNVLQRFLPDFLYQAIKISVTANNVVSYKEMVKVALARKWPVDYVKWPCVFPSWDNSARRKSATIIQNLDASEFSRWYQWSLQQLSDYPADERFVFVNAWNEWAEGCHLEPDQRIGFAYLEAIRDAQTQTKPPNY